MDKSVLPCKVNSVSEDGPPQFTGDFFFPGGLSYKT